MIRRLVSYLAPVMFVAVAGVLPCAAQHGVQDGQWTSYGGDSGMTRYSALDQINKDNVKSLQMAWRWKTDNYGPTPEYYYEATPLMVKGVLYTTAGYRRTVAAINAASGETLWTYRLDEGDRWVKSPRRNSGRGVAYWTDGTNERIFLVTPGFELVALDAKTGVPVSGFGDTGKGIVDLHVGLDRDVVPDDTIAGTSPPIVSHDVVIVGPALQEGTAPKSGKNTPGYVRAYDARTGKKVWTFRTIPQKGEFGNETWEGESWRYTGNTGVWAPISVDDELGYAYLPVEDSTGDHYGGNRLGDNLFSASLVCVDVKTGKRIWHFQMSHHDIWDSDLPAAPILVDVTVDGKPIKAVVQITKQAFAFVFDRVTGKPVWPIEERPVAQSNVPGERTSPTQPFPTKPAPFDMQGLSLSDLIDFTPELHAQAEKIVSQYKIGPLYTPPVLKDGPDGKATIQMPGIGGGAEWNSGSVDPETGILYVSSNTRPYLASMVAPKPGQSDIQYITSSGAVPTVKGLPIYKPPYGRITAIDLNTGNHLWMIANGDTPDEVKNNPALKGVNIPKTGKIVQGSMLVTKSLLFAAVSLRGYGEPILQVLDKKSGERIATLELPAPATGVPMTYMLDGKQYIVVAVGGVGDQSHPGELVAFTIPSATPPKRGPAPEAEF